MNYDSSTKEELISELIKLRQRNQELEAITKGGEIRTGIVSTELLTLKSVTDITERKLLNRKLVDSREHYRNIFKNCPDAILLTQSDGTILNVNPAGCRLLGWTKEEICTRGLSTIVDMDDLRTISAIKERAETGRVHSELTLIRKDGTRFQSETASNLFKTEDGQLLTSMFIRDITERKQAEETLCQSEEKFSKVFHGGPIMMILATVEEGKFIDANKAFCSSSGYTLEGYYRSLH